MEVIESEKADRTESNLRWGLRLLAGGVIVAIGTDLWKLFQEAIEVLLARFL